MTSSTVLVLALVGWLAIGVALSIVLGRRGHEGLTWLVMGAMLGPLALFFAVDSWRHGEGLDVQEVPTPAAAPAPGDEAGLDVMIGFNGSPESRAATNVAIELLGSRLGRLTFATALPFDGVPEDARMAKDHLTEEADRLAWLAPRLEIVHGRPGPALAAAAVAGGFDLLVIGTTRAGHPHLFGSAARDLARDGGVAVLLAGSRARPDPSP